jgi:hypothetical protein
MALSIIQGLVEDGASSLRSLHNRFNKFTDELDEKLPTLFHNFVQPSRRNKNGDQIENQFHELIWDLPQKEKSGVITADSMPEEILISIFKYLGPSPKEILTTAVVSRQWYRLSFDQKVWETLFYKEESRWDSLVSIHGERQDLGKKILNTGSKLLQSIFKSSDAPAEEDESLQTLDWRKSYIKQYIHNTIVAKRIHAHIQSIRKNVTDNENYAFVQPIVNPWEMKSPFAETVRNPFTKKVFRVPMFGEGLETSAKKLVYNMMWGDKSLFKISNLYPGVEGIGSGVGFDLINGAEINLAVMHRYEDRKVFESVRPKWRKFFKNSEGFIFVMSHEVDIAKTKKEMDNFINDQWTRPDAPLLILFDPNIEGPVPDEGEEDPIEQLQNNNNNEPTIAENRDMYNDLLGEQADADNASENSAESLQSSTSSADAPPTEEKSKNYLAGKRPIDIVKELGLEHMKRKWCVRRFNAKSLDGVYEALLWLTTNN